MSWEFIIQNNGIITLVFSGIVALATVVYAVLTWRLVGETIKMRLTQTEPKISINLQSSEQSITMMDLIIQNIGLGPAYNVTFNLTKDFEIVNKIYLSEIGMFKNGISYFAPGQKIQFFITSMVNNYQEKEKFNFDIDVKYENHSKKIYTERFKIDFSEFRGLLRSEETPLHKILKEIGKLRSEFENLIQGTKKLNVNIYTDKNRIEEEKLKEIELERMKKKLKK